jgi:hypothetical protein
MVRGGGDELGIALALPRGLVAHCFGGLPELPRCVLPVPRPFEPEPAVPVWPGAVERPGLVPVEVAVEELDCEEPLPAAVVPPELTV